MTAAHTPPRVCLITGPTSGLGEATALALAGQGMQLVLLGRNRDKLRDVSSRCVALGAPEPHLLVADMAVQSDVRRAAAEFLATDLPLHVLIHNAGMVNQRRRVTVDGVEETFAVHYVSAFLLTCLLVDRLVASRPATILHTASDIYPYGRLALDDARAERGFQPLGAYARSKLATVQLTRMLAERLLPHGVSVNAYNPGMNYTNLGLSNNSGATKTVADFFWSRIAAPVSDGIEIPVRIASAPDLLAENGALYMRGERKPMVPKATDERVGSALFARSEELAQQRWPAAYGRPAAVRVGDEVRFGVLGAARIAPFALLKQTPSVPGVRVAAVAEEYQSYDDTLAYAKKHAIPRVHRRFEDLLRDDDVDAVYLALPTRMHAAQALATIAAGKHLLCEKPLASNADEARRVHAAAESSGLVVAEAMHSLHHPLVPHLRALLGGGELGELVRVEAGFSAYIPQRDFRFVYELSGGVMLDMGCYPVAFLRAVLGTEPEVRSATATPVAPSVDGVMDSRLAFPNAPDVRLFVAMRSLRRPLEVRMRFIGTRGSVDLLNFIKPEVYHHLVVRSPRGRRVVRVPGGSTYQSQLRAFTEAVRGGPPIVTTTGEAVRTLEVIDAIYREAGLPVRGLG
ncbi:MAG: SDR family NAD(P)-dependent oxidoreductase [Sandaracinaceae bacterium]|nr:SDR family NAD(P)-dependent oxidoreductase [Myxococcales bacterium]MCB9658082.1 SDR family NAD(P)-dependent oxidoreductase [Sandaracinaceae bacterium]